MSDIEVQRAARRAAMPITASIVEQYAEFSPRVIFASENGITVGKRPNYTETFDSPHGYGIATGRAKK